MNIHHRNLQRIVTKIFKVKNGLSTELMNNVLKFIKKPYSLQAISQFRYKRNRTTKYDITPSYLGPQLRNFVLLNEDKIIASLVEFKAKANIENCHYRLCKTYIQQVGFMYLPRMIILEFCQYIYNNMSII